MIDKQQSRADALTDDRRQALGEAISEYFEKLDSDEGIRTSEGRILRAFDYCDSRNVDDLIDRAVLPALATSANETGAEGATEQFIVIGHGESDIPEAKIVARRADVLDAVLSMIYGGPCPDDAMRAEYASMLGDWDGDHWNVTFEIGGIDVWRVGLFRSPAMAAAAPADERAAQGLLTIGRCMGIEAAARYIDSAGLTTAIDHAAEIRKLADPEPPRDCSRDPSSCPDNEGYGCWCSDQARAAASPAAAAVPHSALVEVIDSNIESLRNVATAADEKALAGLSKLLRKVCDTLSHARTAIAAPQPPQADAPAEARAGRSARDLQR
ncbi:hypothetical protein QZM28_22840 [Burkholderia multivorans]|nr:hypothetical protein [Burkholderia multivorans]